jgi:anaerobic dimethyl sulfoxide reductase subunit A
MMEREDIVTPWGFGDYVLFMNKAVDTVFQCRNAYDWISDLAKKLGLSEQFTEEKSLSDWAEYLVEKTAGENPDFPCFQEFKKKGIYRWIYEESCIAFKKQIEDPVHNPFPTPSGKIEIFSNRLWNMGNHEKIPAVPQYISAWEGPEDPVSGKYPIQCIGHHSKRRVHSTFDNTGWMEEVEPQKVLMNCEDAGERHVAEGDMVKVFNDRGTIILPVKITSRIMPGVASIPQGGWWIPDEKGIDRRGCINVLTRYKPTPLAFGNPSHTSLVEIEKVY